MIPLVRRTYPTIDFATGDAAQLPFANSVADVVIFGTVLMHLPQYAAALAEGRRVAKSWVIFHTVPTILEKTRTFQKLAYGVPVVEIVFGEQELMDLFASNGLRVHRTFESLPHPYLNQALSRRVAVRTYVCRIS
jgi:hypothetical protein